MHNRMVESRCNMIIRSQNKKSIINFDNLEAVKLIEIQLNAVNNLWDFEIRYYNFEENGELLGIYSTYEKAIKVLDMICDTCRNIAFIDEKAVVFNMPQDSEV